MDFLRSDNLARLERKDIGIIIVLLNHILENSHPSESILEIVEAVITLLSHPTGMLANTLLWQKFEGIFNKHYNFLQVCKIAVLDIIRDNKLSLLSFETFFQRKESLTQDEAAYLFSRANESSILEERIMAISLLASKKHPCLFPTKTAQQKQIATLISVAAGNATQDALDSAFDMLQHKDIDLCCLAADALSRSGKQISSEKIESIQTLIHTKAVLGRQKATLLTAMAKLDYTKLDLFIQFTKNPNADEVTVAAIKALGYLCSYPSLSPSPPASL